MSTTKRLRLGPLPKTQSIKLTFACPARLKANLDLYAEQYAQTYGEVVDPATLIPHMLEAFMAGDRGFRGRDVKRKALIPSAEPPSGSADSSG
ncbi:DUF2274 domain-containing protein [Stenotrophomonas maltophilia]|uniref:DUF2274 domain-containing protein n=1 Tax=Stenotrophomonas maltophilia TaxID=40324 RepID=A0AA40XYU6_STEMA|nr:DUF2274 domain-containing protein [Stenotrophomonas maltophilia]